MLKNDKFRDECGVVAIYAHPEAETLAYLGLHALQHRGQESAGIVSSDGMALHIHKSMGLVADIFTEKRLSRIRGTLAIGHTRYSTAGDSALLNAQPIMVQSNKGMIALAHNGNLTNAQEIRARMEAQGSIFQTSSDTEVIVHLIAQSREQTLPDAIADALRLFPGDDQPRPHLCDSRSARLPPACHGPNSRCPESRRRHHRFRVRDLCFRSDWGAVRAGGQAWRVGYCRSGRDQFPHLLAAASAVQLHL
jgi:glutamate synthase domain-containing protein 1